MPVQDKFTAAGRQTLRGTSRKSAESGAAKQEPAPVSLRLAKVIDWIVTAADVVYTSTGALLIHGVAT